MQFKPSVLKCGLFLFSCLQAKQSENHRGKQSLFVLLVRSSNPDNQAFCSSSVKGRSDLKHSQHGFSLRADSSHLPQGHLLKNI